MEEKMLLYTLHTGEEAHRYKKSIVVNFTGRRRVLSTAPHNGGLREDLTAVFNHDATVGAGMAIVLKAPTYGEHMAILSGELGLSPEHSAGLSTAAKMENVSIQTETWGRIAVTAMVTGGVEINGGRAGDPASWDELTGNPAEAEKPGTINCMVFFNVNLTPGALTRALVTCTEAKTAALQELAAPSRYSRGLATGSGTDGAILCANMDSPVLLADAGKHSKLGELIGRSVKAAVKEALCLQNGLCPTSQHNPLRRISRFGVTEDSLWAKARGTGDGGLRRARFAALTEKLSSADLILTYTALYAHLLDELDWGLIGAEEALRAGTELLRLMEMPGAIPRDKDLLAGACADTMIAALEDGMVSLLRREDEAGLRRQMKYLR
ncbi:MAG: adenosylcobinamide amidohydrolase [Treponema sp.]|jgi:adenosylcobinamide amidohydrolase|nr:adenosylcobinamide amidohydrolase [Treponema sp.]